MPARPALFRRLTAILGALLALASHAAPLEFNLPAHPSAAESLLAFSRQAGVEVLYAYDDLRDVPAAAVVGRFEPEAALQQLLQASGFTARRTLRGKFLVARATPRPGSLGGVILTPAGEPAPSLPVALAGTRHRTHTDGAGAFIFPDLPPGIYRLYTGGPGYRLLEQAGLAVTAGDALVLPPLRLQAATDVTVLDPYVVHERHDRLPIGEGVGAAPRRAAGNLDLPRTTDNALPFTIFSREQIARSGVVQLNEFLQREILESTTTRPPEQDGTASGISAGSSNLRMRGYESDETVVLVNGRRLPETFTRDPGVLGAPDVNLVPLALVQQIEVLPASASALYSGNAVGGVINIVLAPDADGTELRTTYTNALGGFDAPQSSVSLSHGQTLLDGRLRLRFNATHTRTAPPVERDLGYQRARLARTPAAFAPRATPNIVRADPAAPGLFGPGSAGFTSVAPGADGTGGIAAFQGREGRYSTDLFDGPGGLATSLNSRDYLYGREQQRTSWYGSAVYDAFPWLQLGLDATYGRTIVHRGYDIFSGVLDLPAGSPLNPFGQDVAVALHETTPALGQDYNEAQLDSWSLVGGALLKLPAGWRLTLDTQYARNLARYRGLVGVDSDRWQQLVDDGRYQPLRDTQVHGPPPEFYDRALIYYGGPGRFVKLGDYHTLEGAVRLTHEALPLPTGEGTVNLGTDYRLNRLAAYTEEPRYADGTPAAEIVRWSGRTLERMSVFGEIQAPLVPARWLPRAITAVETDSAVRYIISAQSNETSLAPTFGLKVDFRGGLALRGSFTTSNRFPTAVMSRPLAEGGDGGGGSDLISIFDPLRQETYLTAARVAINPDVRPESAATQTAGLVFTRGRTHRFRASLDFADTTKTNEFIMLEPAALLNLESVFPDRVRRDPAGTGRITALLTGAANAARRHSQNWNLAAEYAWPGFAGGRLELRGRWVWFQRYERRLFANSETVDQLRRPDGTAPGLLRHRLTFGAAWSAPAWGFGVDGHYLGARTLPVSERPAQGNSHIKPYWQFDVFAQTDLTRWLPREPEKFRLSAQLRVNNLSGFAFPKYANDISGAGVQAYGDWRGRTYSISLTGNF
ncbi:Vitamin B12 transporter BtuB precursor [Lacunisphaera limnophila]|uniref:Vitamin B12 transporter BtuB n=1 Tax=Lacunisphaera limnophila TaxID=1838286 RepID=A0A1D8AVQ1_9BACT|nr:TonB-dependent receptor plug domain-containing protein [Lacunisphaera limnophila]AOS44951.1 Vitamin B12 transporter BtuB precursor [Lacunisphaera limnophila]